MTFRSSPHYVCDRCGNTTDTGVKLPEGWFTLKVFNGHYPTDVAKHLCSVCVASFDKWMNVLK